MEVRNIYSRHCFLCRGDVIPLVRLSTITYQGCKIKYGSDDVLAPEMSAGVNVVSAGGSSQGKNNGSSEPLVDADAAVINNSLIGTDQAGGGAMPLHELVLNARRDNYHDNTGIDGLHVQACRIGDEAMIREIVTIDPYFADQSFSVLEHFSNETYALPQEPTYRTKKFTLTEIAAENGHKAIVDFFINRGDKKRDVKLDDAFRRAVKNSNKQALSNMIKWQADCTSVMEEAIKNNNVSKINLLWEAGADFKDTLTNAIREKNIALIKTLFTAGIDINPALIVAAQSGLDEHVQTLLEAGADANKAMARAAENTNNSGVTALEKYGGNKNEVLCLFSRLGNREAVVCLLESGAEVNCLRGKKTPVYIAAENRRSELLKILINKGGEAENALALAAQNGNREAVNTLLESGVSPVAKGDNGEALSPLFIAACNGHEEIVKRLSRAGGNEYRSRILSYVVLNGNLDALLSMLRSYEEGQQQRKVEDFDAIVTQIIDDKSEEEAGAVLGKLFTEFHIVCNLGNCFGEIFINAITIGKTAIVKALLKAWPEITLFRNSIASNTPIFYSVFKNKIEITKMLIQSGANINTYNRAGQTPLTIAATMNNKAMVELLIESGAAVDKALKGAVRNGLTLAIDLLWDRCESNWHGKAYRKLLYLAGTDLQGHSIKYLLQRMGSNRTSVKIAFLEALQKKQPTAADTLLINAMPQEIKRENFSPLFIAVVNKQKEVVSKLSSEDKTSIVLQVYQLACAQETELLTFLVTAINDIEFILDVVVDMAVKNDSIDALSSLFRLTVEDGAGRSAINNILTRIVFLSNHSVVESLLKKMPDSDFPRAATHCLNTAIIYKQYAIIKTIVAIYSRTNKKIEVVDGYSLLGTAIENQDKDAMVLLLPVAADTDAQIWHAVVEKKYELLKLFLDCGASFDNAVFRATESGCKDALQILKQAGIPLSVHLKQAAIEGKKESVNLFLAANIELNDDGNSLYEIADNQQEVAKIILADWTKKARNYDMIEKASSIALNCNRRNVFEFLQSFQHNTAMVNSSMVRGLSRADGSETAEDQPVAAKKQKIR